jgi:5-methylcytosine-specific restriction endonuclease McrA
MSPLVYLCPACGTPGPDPGRCASCARERERTRYAAEPSRRLRSTSLYRRQRDTAKQRDGYRCQDCGSSENLEAHHVLPLEQDGEPFALDNLVTLCASCHRQQLGRLRRTREGSD